MAKKKEIEAWLKDSPYTKEQMDVFWEELKETNKKVAALSRDGITWDKMSMSVIQNIPTQKQRDLESKKLKKAQEKAEKKTENKAKENAKYYWEHFNELMVKKIDQGEKLTEKELSTLVEFAIETTYGENRRWSRSVTSIVELCDRYFRVSWEEGLTENQDNEFDDQPEEVQKHTYEKTITVTEWTSINKQNDILYENIHDIFNDLYNHIEIKHNATPDTQFKKGDVVTTNCGLDLGIVKETFNSENPEVYARYSHYDFYNNNLIEPHLYSGGKNVKWYKTGVSSNLNEWKELCEEHIIENNNNNNEVEKE